MSRLWPDAAPDPLVSSFIDELVSDLVDPADADLDKEIGGEPVVAVGEVSDNAAPKAIEPATPELMPDSVTVFETTEEPVMADLPPKTTEIVEEPAVVISFKDLPKVLAARKNQRGDIDVPTRPKHQSLLCNAWSRSW